MLEDSETVEVEWYRDSNDIIASIPIFRDWGVFIYKIINKNAR